MKRIIFLIGSFVLACIGACHADPVLPTLFSDHMVLQQGLEIHVWGKADPGEKIAVSIEDLSGIATADSAGRWSARLPALSAGGPFTLTVRGKKEIVFRDVMIGEVWIASGQSNMAFQLSGADGAAVEVPKADYAQIRLFTVPRKIALAPQENTLLASWQICTPDTAKTFSAVAYFFAREIHRELNVPIGIIESAWPGTTIESWIDPDTLNAEPDLKLILDEWNRSSLPQKEFAEQPQPFELEFDDFELLLADGSGAKRLATLMREPRVPRSEGHFHTAGPTRRTRPSLSCRRGTEAKASRHESPADWMESKMPSWR